MRSPRLLAPALLSIFAGLGACVGGSQHAPLPLASPSSPPVASGSIAVPLASAQAAALATPEASSSASQAISAAPTPTRDRRPNGPALGSIAHITWLYAGSSRSGQPIGFVRPGTAVELVSGNPVAGTDCAGGRWYEVKPKGYVCADAHTTMDLDLPLYRALASTAPLGEAVFPYRYAMSTGAPMYGRIPSAEEQKKVERVFRPIDRLPRNQKPHSGYEELATDELIAPTDEVPFFLQNGGQSPQAQFHGAGLVRKQIPEGSMLSFTAAFEAKGRTYLLAPNLTIVPADRVRPFRISDFHGVEIKEEVKLPLAWIRHAAKSLYKRSEEGFSASDESLAPRTWIGLSGQKVEQGALVYLETTRSGLFVKESEVSVVEERKNLPLNLGANDRWIDFDIGDGTFTLYEGPRAVFTTLASPGAGGTPPGSAKTNAEHVKGSWTPVGIYRINYKVRSTTMTPENTPNPQKHWISDVAYAQYFRMPFAIHAAYWHEDFGMPKSGGCINLSPTDAQRVFFWTDPKPPSYWTGVSGSQAMGLGTVVVVRR